jgi:hypothetical protein
VSAGLCGTKDPHQIKVLLRPMSASIEGDPSLARSHGTSTAQDDVLREREASNSYGLSCNEISDVKSFHSGLVELTSASFHLRVFRFMYFSLAIASTIESKP